MPWETQLSWYDLYKLNDGQEFTQNDVLTFDIINKIVMDIAYLRYTPSNLIGKKEV